MRYLSNLTRVILGIVAIIGLLTTTLSTPLAKNTTQITGKIFYRHSLKNKHVGKGIEVRLLDPRGKVRLTTKTNPSGSFQFQQVPLGTYSLVTNIKGAQERVEPQPLRISQRTKNYKAQVYITPNFKTSTSFAETEFRIFRISPKGKGKQQQIATVTVKGPKKLAKNQLGFYMIVIKTKDFREHPPLPTKKLFNIPPKPVSSLLTKVLPEIYDGTIMLASNEQVEVDSPGVFHEFLTPVDLKSWEYTTYQKPKLIKKKKAAVAIGKALIGFVPGVGEVVAGLDITQAIIDLVSGEFVIGGPAGSSELKFRKKFRNENKFDQWPVSWAFKEIIPTVRKSTDSVRVAFPVRSKKAGKQEMDIYVGFEVAPPLTLLDKTVLKVLNLTNPIPGQISPGDIYHYLRQEITVKIGKSFRIKTTISPKAGKDIPGFYGKALDLYYHHYHTLGESIRYFRETVKSRPAFAHAYAGLGNALLKKLHQCKNYWKAAQIQPLKSEALSHIKRVLDLNDKLSYAYKALGYYYQTLGKDSTKLERFCSTPIECFKKAINLNPSLSDPYANLGYLYQKKGKVEEAKEYYKKTISYDPYYIAPYVNLGALYYRQKNFKKAKELVNRAIKQGIEAPPIYNLLGMLFYQKGKKKKAEEKFEKAKNLDPEYADPYCNLSILYKKRGDDKLAKKYRKQCEKLNKKVPKICK